MSELRESHEKVTVVEHKRGESKTTRVDVVEPILKIRKVEDEIEPEDDGKNHGKSSTALENRQTETNLFNSIKLAKQVRLQKEQKSLSILKNPGSNNVTPNVIKSPLYVKGMEKQNTSHDDQEIQNSMNQFEHGRNSEMLRSNVMAQFWRGGGSKESRVVMG